MTIRRALQSDARTIPHVHHGDSGHPGRRCARAGRRAQCAEHHRRGGAQGQARDLIWPWFAANVSVFGISYGAFLLGFGISFGQGVAVGLIGIVISLGLCGIVSLAGKHGSAPTMALSRAAFGVNGNRVPSVLSWLLTVGDGARLAGRAGHLHGAE